MSQQKTLEVGSQPEIHLSRVRMDLNISGEPGDVVTVEARRIEDLSIDQAGDRITIASESTCRLRVPPQARISIGDVGGDLRASQLEEPMAAESVGGDASLKHIGGIQLGSLGGDLKIARANAACSAETVGGDAKVKDVEGSVKIGAAGGNLSIGGVAGEVAASVGGDALYEGDGSSPRSVRLEAGGDLAVKLDGELSLQAEYSAGGDQVIALPGAPSEGNRSGQLRIGDGALWLSLRAGGDLFVGAKSADGAEAFDEDFGASIAALVGEKMAEVEMAISSMGAGMDLASRDEISRRVRQVVRRAMARQERQARRRTKVKPLVSLAGGASAAPNASIHDSNEEHLRVLKMVEEGKLSVDDAEKLLEALEN